MIMRGLRQYVGAGASQANCPSEQWNSNLQVCCAPGDGSIPAIDDPCSWLNASGYQSTQTAAQTAAVQGSAGQFSNELSELSQYSNAVQTAALDCISNPGLKYTDQYGNVITCPSASVDDNGIYISAYTAEQLAPMIAAQAKITGAPITQVLQNPSTTTNPVTKGSSTTTGGNSSISPSGSSNTGSSGSSGNSNSTSGGSSSTSSTSDLSFLTDDSLISGIPNWGIAAAALVALMFLPKLMGAR